jgi:DNA-directed RNA polymerase specialized sigma24 family protein
MGQDTEMGGPSAAFPPTRCSVIFTAASQDAETRKLGFESLVAAYWKPVYKYVRLKWALGNEDAKDLTQSFFLQALKKGFLKRYDPAKARFRTFLRVCVDGFVANERKFAKRLKRGADVELLSLDFALADGEVRSLDLPSSTAPDEFFDRDWVRSLFGLAVEDLRRQCEESGKTAHFALFERYDLDSPPKQASLSYVELGREFGSETALFGLSR